MDETVSVPLTEKELDFLIAKLEQMARDYGQNPADSPLIQKLRNCKEHFPHA